MPPNLNSLRMVEGLPAKLRLELDLLPGISCILDSSGTIRQVSRSWDQFFARADRNELQSSSVTGAPFAALFSEEEAQSAIAVSLEELRTEVRETSTQILDAGSSTKPLLISFLVRWCHDERGRNGFLVHGWDVTQEYLTRSALLDRERKLHEARSSLISLEREIEECRKALAERDQELSKLRATVEELQRAATQRSTHADHPSSVRRQLTANLAEEFSNLLTGVLGHSSLAAAELSDSHAAVNDIRAIEQTTREAARVTRRLSALCGTARRGSTGIDLRTAVEQYVKRHNTKVESKWEFNCESSDGSWMVSGDHGSLEIILEAMGDHVWKYGGSQSSWVIGRAAGEIAVTAEWSAEAGVPAGWTDADWSIQTRLHPDELLFAREVARALEGELRLTECEATSRLELILPARAPERTLAAT